MISDILTLSKELIRIPSVGGNWDELHNILALVKRELVSFSPTSFLSNNYSSLLYTNQPDSTKQFKIILNAHLDIVPADASEYVPYEAHGKLYGRGAKDMKAAGAVMILLFKELADVVKYPLALQIVTDEEPGGLDGTAYQVKQGIRGEFVICGEGTNLTIIHKAKARMVVKLITNGRSAHSAYPWLGDNAIVNMHKAIANILHAYPTPKEESDKTIVSVTSIDTENKVYNKIPENCTAYLDIRFVPEEKESIVATIQSCLPENIRMEILLKFHPHDTNPENKYIKLLQNTGKDILKKNIPLGMAHGASDAPFYTQKGCDAIEFGPSGANHHAIGEWVDIKSLEDYYHILKKFLLEANNL